MNYKPGFTIKPYEIRQGSGEVMFTDGTTNDIRTNQYTCEAYGYRWESQSGTCIISQQTPRVEKVARNETNIIRGANNTTRMGTRNSFIIGENNICRGLSTNNIIAGSNNEIASGVNNATVLGNYGKAERDGEVVIGGGAFEGAGAGYGQSSIITLSGQTTDATKTNLFVNKTDDTIIARDDSVNSFQGFKADVIGVRTGGVAVSGAVNDRFYVSGSGLIYLKDLQGGYMGRATASYGIVTGWEAEMDFSGTNDLHLAVTGAVDMDISWSATLQIYQIIV